MGKRWCNLRNTIETIVFGDLDEVGIAKQVVALCCGNDSVFDVTWPVKVRLAIHSWLGRQTGDYPKGDPIIAHRQPFYLDILYFVLREAGDPDFAICKEFSAGVNLGVTEPLPHTPAVFECKIFFD